MGPEQSGRVALTGLGASLQFRHSAMGSKMQMVSLTSDLKTVIV